MALINPLYEHHQETRQLALRLSGEDIYHWLLKYGYYPEAYVLPPCFSVEAYPKSAPRYFPLTSNGKFKVTRAECVTVHFPKTRLSDRTFGIIDPAIHHDIVCDLTENWPTVVAAMLPENSQVISFGFPVPIDAQNPGRLGKLRSGRSIYEFLRMAEDQIVSVAYQYSHIVRTDIKNYYRSIYTHAIPWAMHGKVLVRQKQNVHNFSLLGNRLDALFQNANDGCTNGIPIGPVVSDIVAEIIASAVDVRLTALVQEKNLKCEIVRFKDDYRILVNAENDGVAIVKYLQSALKDFHLELAEEKTEVLSLPDGLFRPWVSRYHAAYPRKRARFSWREFRELYLAVLRIDRECPGTGVIDRFLADIVSKSGIKISLDRQNLQKTLSMLLMLARPRIKAFPKILAIIESILATPLGIEQRLSIIAHLEEHLNRLAADEERNKYLIAWISYFLVSNGLEGDLQCKPALSDAITRMALNNEPTIFLDRTDFTLFRDCKTSRQGMTLLEYLNVFEPPKEE